LLLDFERFLEARDFDFKRFPRPVAIAGAEDRAAKAVVVRFVLADLPPQPLAFAENRRRNLSGE